MFNKPGPVEVIPGGDSFREQVLGADCYTCSDSQTEEKSRQKKAKKPFWIRRLALAARTHPARR